jgi:hypothetical protein
VYYVEQGEFGEYKKYLRWHGMRLKKFVIGKPSEEIEAAYKRMRRGNTDQYIADAGEKLTEIERKNKKNKEGKYERKQYATTDYTNHPNVLAIRDDVMRLRSEGLKDNTIANRLKTTRYWVGKV